MSWAAGLINELKDNPKQQNTGIQGPIIGTVIAIEPLRLSTSNGAIILDETIHDLYICNNLELNFKDDIALKKDDDLMLIPDESGQVFFIIDKVRKLGSD